MENTPKLPFDNSPFILPLYKPSGISSFDCIRDVKKYLFEILGKGKGRRKLKIGHFGTLDPFAEGVLLVGTGKALKLMKFFQEEMTKGYLARGSYQYSTDTGDIEGTLLKNSSSTDGIDSNAFSSHIKAMVGEYLQRPPYFSAVKHEGRPLYEWAREGVYIEKDPVQRKIHRCEFLSSNELERTVDFSCHVSSGTYIRGLWVDIAAKMDLFGHLVNLERTHWGTIEAKDCLPLESCTVDSVKNALKRPQELWDLPSVTLCPSDELKFVQGQFLELSEGHSSTDLSCLPSRWKQSQNRGWVFNKEGTVLGLGILFSPDSGHSSQEFLKVSVSLT